MTTAHDIFRSDPALFARIAEQVESGTCEYPCCQRGATVTLTFESGTSERFCHIHAEELAGRP